MSTTSKQIVSKSWIFTINNPTEKDIGFVKAVPCQKIICEKEVGESGTPHLQGAIIWKKAMTTGLACKALGGRAHVKKMAGSWADQEYCLKEGTVFRMEDNTKQGARTDVDKFRKTILANPRKRAMDMDDQDLASLAKYPRLESRLKMEALKVSTRAFRKVEVIVHYGKAGTGKTKGPYEEGAFVFDDYEHGWWDGYDGESVILLDDFYGGIKWSFFLRLLDGYQVRLKVKGGFTYANWTKIYITSNTHPSEWYSKGYPPELERRITKIIKFT